MANAVLNEAKDKMTKSEESLSRELGQIRAGRANASLLDRIQVDYYGAPTPLNQIAGISIPEARVLMITPFDKSALENIEKAILASDIGISPTNDGSIIRLVIPQLTEERRKELAKEVGKFGENAKVAVRNIRRDALDELKKMEKAKEISKELQIFMVLKDHYSQVITPDQEVFYNINGNSGMAKGGSGDVLTGIITSLLAQKYSPQNAALFGVWLHGKAGDFAAEKFSKEAMLASDLIEQISKVFKILKN